MTRKFDAYARRSIQPQGMISGMAELRGFVSEADLSGRWWRRLGRSFQVPDLAVDVTALLGIAAELGDPFVVTDSYDPTFVAEALIAAFLKDGEKGDREDILFRKDKVRERVAPSNKFKEPTSRILDTAKNLSGVRGHLEADDAAMWGGMTENLVNRFTADVERLPHEDEFGHYFTH